MCWGEGCGWRWWRWDGKGEVGNGDASRRDGGVGGRAGLQLAKTRRVAAAAAAPQRQRLAPQRQPLYADTRWQGGTSERLISGWACYAVAQPGAAVASEQSLQPLTHSKHGCLHTCTRATSPSAADALFYAAKSCDDAFSADELKEVAKYQTIVEDAVGGELKVFKEGDDVDSVHW